ncbi:MAG: cation-efflux pump, partial [Microcystis sp. M53601_WE4]|nr:cation-efflux pump [Microcystis sp. M53601_WE4]
MAVLKDNRATVQKVLWITLMLNILVMAIKAGVGLRIGALSL